MPRSDTPDIRIGTCGFAEAQDTIFRDFSILEVQKTFYQPPKVSIAEKWRRKAPNNFVFSVKAWQLITHESSSRTYRHLRTSLTDEQRNECGRFRWNETTQWAWDRTQEIADALDAGAILFQTPRSFEPTEKNRNNLRTLLSEIDRQERIIVFEPRGSHWTQALIADLADELRFVHGVDPFIRPSATPGLRYYRLHGRPEYEYSYEYTPEDLNELEKKISEEESTWILFNNRTMANDARMLQKRVDPTNT